MSYTGLLNPKPCRRARRWADVMRATERCERASCPPFLPLFPYRTLPGQTPPVPRPICPVLSSLPDLIASADLSPTSVCMSVCGVSSQLPAHVFLTRDQPSLFSVHPPHRLGRHTMRIWRWLWVPTEAVGSAVHLPRSGSIPSQERKCGGVWWPLVIHLPRHHCYYHYYHGR